MYKLSRILSTFLFSIICFFQKYDFAFVSFKGVALSTPPFLFRVLMKLNAFSIFMLHDSVNQTLHILVNIEFK